MENFDCLAFVAQFKISYNIVTKEADFPFETRMIALKYSVQI